MNVSNVTGCLRRICSNDCTKALRQAGSGVHTADPMALSRGGLQVQQPLGVSWKARRRAGEEDEGDQTHPGAMALSHIADGFST